MYVLTPYTFTTSLIQRYLQSLAQISNPNLRGIMPDKNTLRQCQPYPQATSLNQLITTLQSVLTPIDGVSFQDELASDSLLVQATSNTWSRAARRKAKLNQESQDVQETTMKCRIVCTTDLMVEFSWIEGKDRRMFESFCSHVIRKADRILEDGR
jgi:hypothetical protein